MSENTSQAEVDGLLKRLRVLLEQIAPLRKRVSDTREAMRKTQRDYDARMREVNLAAEDLDWRIRSLNILLQGGTALPQPVVEDESQAPEEEVRYVAGSNDQPAPSVPAEPPGRALKRALANHIYYFSDDPSVLSIINGVVDDDRRGLGDMLEILPWGPVWESRASDWESHEQQAERLSGWVEALEARLKYWTGQERAIEQDGSYALQQRRKEFNELEWQAYLDGLARDQEAENVLKREELRKLEAKSHRQAAAREESTRGGKEMSIT